MSSSPKISETSSYAETSQLIKSYGYERIVFTNGCFDLLHAGHLKLLRECRKIAGPKGTVVVGVNSDASANRLKGFGRPVFNEEHRCMMLVHLKPVDHVIVFEEDTPLDLIENLRPDVIVKGADYLSSVVVGSHIAPVIFVEMEKDLSSTSLLGKFHEHT